MIGLRRGLRDGRLLERHEDVLHERAESRLEAQHERRLAMQHRGRVVGHEHARGLHEHARGLIALQRVVARAGSSARVAGRGRARQRSSRQGAPKRPAADRAGAEHGRCAAAAPRGRRERKHVIAVKRRRMRWRARRRHVLNPRCRHGPPAAGRARQRVGLDAPRVNDASGDRAQRAPVQAMPADRVDPGGTSRTSIDTPGERRPRKQIVSTRGRTPPRDHTPGERRPSQADRVDPGGATPHLDRHDAQTPRLPSRSCRHGTHTTPWLCRS